MRSDSVGSLSPGRSSRLAMREVMLSTSMPVRLRPRRGPGGSAGSAVGARRALMREERVLDTVARRALIIGCTMYDNMRLARQANQAGPAAAYVRHPARRRGRPPINGGEIDS